MNIKFLNQAIVEEGGANCYSIDSLWIHFFFGSDSFFIHFIVALHKIYFKKVVA